MNAEQILETLFQNKGLTRDDVRKALADAWRAGHQVASREYERDDLEPGETPNPFETP